MAEAQYNPLGYVTAISGARCSVRLYEREDAHERITIGRLVVVHTGATEVIGVVSRVNVAEASASEPGGNVVIEIDFLGEVKNHGTDEAFFQRGMTEYPTIGDHIAKLATGDGDYYGIQGVNWSDPPILKNPSETRRVHGKDYQLYYEGGKLALVAFHRGEASYWVANTLMRKLTEKQMLALAESLRMKG